MFRKITMKWLNRFKHDKEAIRVMIDFVEGNYDLMEFYNLCKNDVRFINTLKQEPDLDKVSESVLSVISWLKPNTIEGQFFLRGGIERFLKKTGYEFNPIAKYREEYLLMLDITPGYVEEISDFMFHLVVDNSPKDLSKTKYIKWCKDELKKYYRYEKTYPRWIQGGNWPYDEDGYPLLFKYQKSNKDDCKVYYYFYDEEKDKEVVVVDMY